MAGIVLDAFPIFVQQILPPLFLAPASVRVQRPDGTHEMEVGIRRLSVRFVETDVTRLDTLKVEQLLLKGAPYQKIAQNPVGQVLRALTRT